MAIKGLSTVALWTLGFTTPAWAAHDLVFFKQNAAGQAETEAKGPITGTTLVFGDTGARLELHADRNTCLLLARDDSTRLVELYRLLKDRPDAPVEVRCNSGTGSVSDRDAVTPVFSVTAE